MMKTTDVAHKGTHKNKQKNTVNLARTESPEEKKRREKQIEKNNK